MQFKTKWILNFSTWPPPTRKLKMKQSNGFDENNKIQFLTIPTRKLFLYQNPFNCIQFINGAPPHPPPTASPLSIHSSLETNSPTGRYDKFFTIKPFLMHSHPLNLFPAASQPVGNFAITSSTLLIRGWTPTKKRDSLSIHSTINQSIPFLFWTISNHRPSSIKSSSIPIIIPKSAFIDSF